MKRNKHQASRDNQHLSVLHRPWFVAGSASLLTWASFPPLGLFPLAWIAAMLWATLATNSKPPGRRGYWAIWGLSALMWGVLLEGVGRAYWANYFGLVLLGAYLGIYQVLFVGLSRVAIHRLKVSAVLAAPAIWTGLELVRGYMITGFSMALLGHTQVSIKPLIQLADVCGAYGVSFLVMFVGAGIARLLPSENQRRVWWPAVAATVAIVFSLSYGRLRMNESKPLVSERTLKVALIQGTEDTVLDPETAQQRASDTFNQYWRLTLDVVEKHDDIDLIVWPEGVFSGNVPQLVTEGQVLAPPESNLTPEDVEQIVKQRKSLFDDKTSMIAKLANRTSTDGGQTSHRTHLLVGGDAVVLSGLAQRNYNSAFLINPDGEVPGRYDKMHRVLIGEYVPFGEEFPWLYNLMPLPRGLSRGEQPVSFDVNEVIVSPSICFEDTVPHLIRRQFQELAAKGNEPDVLINLTNDGWFWGTAILDLQLNCAIFRAIELRRPMLVAANTGLTASIDSNGTVQETMPRRVEGAVISQVTIAKRFSIYRRWGDLFAGTCLLFCLVTASAGLRPSLIKPPAS